MNPYDADIGGPVEEVVSAEKSQPNLVKGAKNKAETDPLLVALNKITDETPLPEAVKIYQSLGFKIFPLQAERKEPLPGSHGHKEATNDLDQLLKWWEKNPNYNIGLLCDEASFTLIDVDKPSDLCYPGKGSHTEDGEKSLKEKGLVLPETLTAETWSGGKHKFFLYAPDAGKSDSNIKVGPQNTKLYGIDRRNEGKGFAVVAPSVIRAEGEIDAQGKKSEGPLLRYRWTELVPPAPYPEALKTIVSSSPTQSADLFSSTTPKRGLTREEALQRMERMKASRPKPPAKTYDEDEKRRRASAYLATLPPSNEGSGEGSNNLLHAAGVLVVGFQLDDATALEMLWSEYNPRCSPVWERNASNEAVYVRKLKEARRTTTKPLGYLLNAERTTFEEESAPPEMANAEEGPTSLVKISLPPFTNVTIVPTMKDGKVVNLPKPKKINALSAEIFRDY